MGLLISGVLAFGLYLISLQIVLSIWRPDFINGYYLLLVLSTSFGTSIGGFIAWFERDYTVIFQGLIIAIVFVCSLTGAYIGLQRGIELMPDIPPWKYGLPILSLAIRGAVISANAPLLALAIYKALRSPRL